MLSLGNELTGVYKNRLSTQPNDKFCSLTQPRDAERPLAPSASFGDERFLRKRPSTCRECSCACVYQDTHMKKTVDEGKKLLIYYVKQIKRRPGLDI